MQKLFLHCKTCLPKLLQINEFLQNSTAKQAAICILQLINRAGLTNCRALQVLQQPTGTASDASHLQKNCCRVHVANASIAKQDSNANCSCCKNICQQCTSTAKPAFLNYCKSMSSCRFHVQHKLITTNCTSLPAAEVATTRAPICSSLLAAAAAAAATKIGPNADA
jgi:hypothetical protein